MQIGPASSALQALGMSPAAPETIRMKMSAADPHPIEPTGAERLAGSGRTIEPPAGMDARQPDDSAALRRGARIDVLV